MIYQQNIDKKMKKTTINYSEAVAEIEEILRQIENQEIDIDELSKKVSRAAELIKACSEKLRNTEKEIETIFEDK
jgi:exodeoxyribonuclease VII small subunit